MGLDATGDVWHSSRQHGGQWSTPSPLVDSGAGHVSWLYANTYTLAGQRVLGYTFDLGPREDNGGDIRYRHMALGARRLFRSHLGRRFCRPGAPMGVAQNDAMHLVPRLSTFALLG